MLDFWERAACAYPGRRHSAGVGHRPAAVYDDASSPAARRATPVDDDERARIKRFNATLVNHLFLLYFDTRVGSGDTGPYPLADGRVLLVRDFYRLAQSDFWWSDVATAVPYQNLTAALVLDDVRIDRVTDFGTSNTTPEDYLDRLVGFGLFTTDGEPPGAAPGAARRARRHRGRRPTGAVRPLPPDRGDGSPREDPLRRLRLLHVPPAVRRRGRRDRRGLDRAAGHPGSAYELLSAIEGDNAGVEDDGPYYAPLV